MGLILFLLLPWLSWQGTPPQSFTPLPTTAPFDGMVMPVEGLVPQKTPLIGAIPLNTVWCGSYYYYPVNYRPRNAKEARTYSTRSTGSGSHPGVDIPLYVGTPIRSVARGTIILAEWREGWGNLLVIEHRIPRVGKIYSVYGHLSGFLRTKGPVEKGEFICYSGQTGTIYPHLHFQIDRNSFPYYPSGSGAYPYASPMHPVNQITQIPQVKKNTFDPLLFIQQHSKK